MTGSSANRRQALRQLVAFGAAPALAATTSGCADLIPQDVGLALAPTPLTDPAVLNFALNLEYLEAEYYLLGVTGRGLDPADTGPDPGAVTGGRRVSFVTPALAEFAAELAEDERAHVRFIRGAIKGSPLVEISRPAIDFTGGFRTAGQAAGLGSAFDPFSDETSFLLGALFFEDLGVTAYNGASDLIADKGLLEQAAGILAVEGYHSGMIRAQLLLLGSPAVQTGNALCAARDRLDGPGTTDEGLSVDGRVNFVPSDAAAKAFRRTPQQVLNVAYLASGPNVRRGGFFPAGVNGVVDVT